MTNGEFKLELENRTVAFSVAVLRTLRKIPVGIESRNIYLMLYDTCITLLLPMIVAIPPIVLTELELRKRFG